MAELTDVEKKIFDAVSAEYSRRGKLVDDSLLIKVIRLGNTNGDGYKRICRIGETKMHLVPIEDIILYGVKAQELDKYPFEHT
jgi:hypothetical protein